MGYVDPTPVANVIAVPGTSSVSATEHGLPKQDSPSAQD